jgi:hypothetical protein
MCRRRALLDYQPCNIGFTHPSYEGWHHTHAALPNCSRAGPNEPLMNGQGCNIFL